MKKNLLLIFFSLLFIINAKAQFPGMPANGQKVTVKGRITAVIIDSLTNKPVDYATVSLMDVKTNKAVNGGITDDKGKIVLQNVVPNEYKFMVGFIGYTTKTILIKTTPEKPDNNLGNIILTGTSNKLNEVVVEGKKSIVENKIDRLVYNAESDATNAGGDATDVMRKVPMLSVDLNGNIQMRGSSVRVLINGKPSGTMANSVGDALKMLPADQIKSVEVITNPSAKYEAEGSGGIVNIITKKSNAEGISGNVNASVGTRSNTGAFNLTAKTGRLSVNTALGTQLAYPQDTRVVFGNQTTAINPVTNLPVTTAILQDGTSKWDRKLYNGSLGLDYDFNAFSNISTNAKYNSFSNGGPGNSVISTNNIPTGNITSDTDMGNGNLDWNIDYNLKTKKRQMKLAV